MMKKLCCGILMIIGFFAVTPVFAQNAGPSSNSESADSTTVDAAPSNANQSGATDDSQREAKFRMWDEYLVGSGGSVGSLWTFGGTGVEYSFFRDDANHEITGSADFFNDRTSYSGQKILAPFLANYRWYVGQKAFNGFYLSAGLGEAVPFGLDHGSGSFAWDGGMGYVVSKRMAVAVRYLRRKQQQVTNSTNTLTTNDAFLGGMGYIRFW